MNNINFVFKKILCVVLIVLCAIFMCSAYIEFDSDFLIEEKDSAQAEKFLNSTAFTVLDKMPQGYQISCFDVNEDGQIAIVFNGLDAVAVLDQTGEFIYGVKVKVQGSLYVEWGTECLNVICVRGSTIVSLDDKGNILNVGTVAPGNDLISASTATTRVVGTETYKLSNKGVEIVGFLSGGYSKIEKYTEHNKETVTIYDVSENTHSKFAIITIGISVWLGVISAIAFFSIRNAVRNKRYVK